MTLKIATRLLSVIAIQGSFAQAEPARLPPELFESKALSGVVALMNENLLAMTCKPLAKSLSANDGGFLLITHAARDTEVCLRNDQSGETRPYFRSVIFEVSGDSETITAFRAKYPIDYQIPDSGALAFFEGLAKILEQGSLRGFQLKSQDHSLKNGRGIIRRHYQNGPLHFLMELTLKANDEFLGSPRSTVVTLSTRFDA